MNINEARHPWSRLVAGARTARDDRDDTAPYGFATRVAALAFAQDRRVASVLDRFALRAVGIACLLAIASVVINYSSMKAPGPAEDHALMEDDPMAVLLDA